VIFKKGDLVTFKKSLLGGSPVSNKIGIVQSVHSFREISGSNGDFFTERLRDLIYFIASVKLIG
jgi:hypothetical protein